MKNIVDCWFQSFIVVYYFYNLAVFNMTCMYTIRVMHIHINV